MKSEIVGVLEFGRLCSMVANFAPKWLAATMTGELGEEQLIGLWGILGQVVDFVFASREDFSSSSGD
jgi:hypothetical protein